MLSITLGTRGPFLNASHLDPNDHSKSGDLIPTIARAARFGFDEDKQEIEWSKYDADFLPVRHLFTCLDQEHVDTHGLPRIVPAQG